MAYAANLMGVVNFGYFFGAILLVLFLLIVGRLINIILGKDGNFFFDIK